jgi:hypothetical protein
MSKPADFMLGLLDFFGVLLPGMIAAWLGWLHLPPDFKLAIEDARGEQATVMVWILFLFASYALGHFVFGIAAKLDPVYDKWRKRTKKKDSNFLAATELRERLTPKLASGDFSTLKWARTYVGIHSPASRLEIDRYEATSKFFRSMVVVSVALALEFLLSSPNLVLATASVACCALSVDRFFDQRWKMTELTYASAIILKATSPQQKAPTGSGQGAGSDASADT